MKLLYICALAAILVGCGSEQYFTDFTPIAKNTFGHAKPSTPATMRPYTVAGKRYYPAHVNIGDTQSGIASWYGPGFHGKLTSNGERFDTHSLTAAHKTLPMNTIVRVDNLENGRSVTVRINDRGPFVAGRIIDLSNAAAHAIQMTQKGTARVRLSVVGFAKAGFNNTAISTNKSAASKQIASTKASNDLISQAATNAVKEIIGGDFMLQIGAFKAASNANAFAARQNHKGHAAKVINSSDGFYRVFLQGFRSEEEAKDFAAAARLLGSFILRQ